MSKKNNRDMLRFNQNISIASGSNRTVIDLDQNSRTYRRLVKKGKIKSVKKT